MQLVSKLLFLYQIPGKTDGFLNDVMGGPGSEYGLPMTAIQKCKPVYPQKVDDGIKPQIM